MYREYIHVIYAKNVVFNLQTVENIRKSQDDIAFYMLSLRANIDIWMCFYDPAVRH